MTDTIPSLTAPPPAPGPEAGAAVPTPSAARERLLGLIAGGATQAALARQIGVSQATLSQWLAGKYRGSAAEVEAAVGRYLGAQERALERGEVVVDDPPFVPMPTAERIFPVLRYAQARGAMVAIVGAAGLGKTTAVTDYAARHPNVWRVIASHASGAVGATLLAIADAIGIQVVSRAKSDLERAVVEKLVRSRGLLVIDEAQYLETATLYELSSLREKSTRPDERGVGVVLMGNPQVWSRIKGAYAQLTSRFSAPLVLTRPRAGDIDALIDAWHRHLRLPPPPPDWRLFVRQVGESAGALRNVSETYRYAAFLCAGAETDIDLAALRDAWECIGGAAK